MDGILIISSHYVTILAYSESEVFIFIQFFFFKETHGHEKPHNLIYSQPQSPYIERQRPYEHGDATLSEYYGFLWKMEDTLFF